MDKSVLIYIYIYKESTCVGMELIIEEYAMIEGTRRSKIKMIKWSNYVYWLLCYSNLFRLCWLNEHVVSETRYPLFKGYDQGMMLELPPCYVSARFLPIHSLLLQQAHYFLKDSVMRKVEGMEGVVIIMVSITSLTPKEVIIMVSKVISSSS